MFLLGGGGVYYLIEVNNRSMYAVCLCYTVVFDVVQY